MPSVAAQRRRPRARGRGRRRPPRRARRRRTALACTLPPSRPGSTIVTSAPAMRGLARRDQAGDAAADHDDRGHGAAARTRSASAPSTAGSSLSTRVRAKASPTSAATAGAPRCRGRRPPRGGRSRSPAGTRARRRRDRWPPGRGSRRGCRGPATARACGRPTASAIDQPAHRSSPTASATAAADSRSWSGYGSSTSARSGSEWAVNSTLVRSGSDGERVAHRAREEVEVGGLEVPAVDRRRRGTPAPTRRPRGAPGTGRPTTRE